MSSLHNKLTFLAGTPGLTPEAAVKLSIHKSAPARRALALNESISEELRQKLTRDRDPGVRLNALRGCQDASFLKKAAKGGPEKQRALAANPKAGELIRELDLTNNLVVRAALTNPSLPLDLGITLAKQWKSQTLFGGALSSLAPSGIGAILSVHPHLGVYWASDPDGGARRAVARQPDVTEEAVELIAKRKGGTWGDALALNPYVEKLSTFSARQLELRERLELVLHGRDPFSLVNESPVEQAAMAWFGSPTLDVILSKQALVPDDVLIFAAQRGCERSFGRPHSWTSGILLEGDTLARMIDRASPEAHKVASEWLSLSKFRGAELHSEVLRRKSQWIPQGGLSEAENAALSLLGEDPRRWDTLFVLAQNWVGSFEEMIKAALEL